MKTILLQGESETDLGLMIALAKKLKLRVQIIAPNEDQESISWNDLTERQKKGLLESIDQIEQGLGVESRDVLAKYHQRYARYKPV